MLRPEWQSLKLRLVEKFPEEKIAIRKYFRDVKKAQHWVAGWFMS